MICLVTGGRDYADRARVFAELDRVHAETPIAWLVNGACPTGADAHANAWFDERAHEGMLRERLPADWKRHGKAAGPMRNAVMVGGAARSGLPALCLAFPGGSGTRDCVRRARAAGISVKVVE
jgi:hypothetical protein